jgi:hypothetical protein
MTIRELFAAMQGAAEAEERAYRVSWTQARWIAATVIQPHSKKSIKPTDLMRFPWERGEQLLKRRRNTEEENRREIEKLRKIFKHGAA